MPSSRSPSRLSVMFDDDHAVADASLALVGMLSECLGLEELAQEFIEVRPFPERRVATLVHAMVAGAQCIDDTDLCCGPESVSAVLAHKVMAPSTLGTFLRRFHQWNANGHCLTLPPSRAGNLWATGLGCAWVCPMLG
jgi:hypothetical protein